MRERKCLIIKRFILFFIIFSLTFYIGVEKKRLQALIKLSEKNSVLYLFSTQWLYRKINGEDVFKCLKDNGYKRIAIYGKNHSCECLCSELEKMEIKVPYIIDDKSVGRYGNIPIIKRDNMLNDVDAIIITNLENTETIRKNLKEVYSGTILTLEDIVKWG